ncbi:hypothetical protein KIW84_014690 [Lathyrus oleraceus]|uniref:CCHC-type domain-containing protein n=1 Tax=Pisum sativum TaxID=3888 RepID=A0A9D5BNN1_PEA|nr:hypothetical protein KIW84_014690 [Pisum sativum]
MAVSAVEQLQVMASKRQYKEAAAQLEAVNQLCSHFEAYRDIPKIIELREKFKNIKQILKSHVFSDFSSLGTGKETEETNLLQQLSDACLVVDALEPSVKEELVNNFCNRELTSYEQIFEGAESEALVTEYRGRSIYRKFNNRDKSRGKSRDKFNEKSWARKDVECFYCHEKGHIKRECRKLKREQQENGDASNIATTIFQGNEGVKPVISREHPINLDPMPPLEHYGGDQIEDIEDVEHKPPINNGSTEEVTDGNRSVGDNEDIIEDYEDEEQEPQLRKSSRIPKPQTKYPAMEFVLLTDGGEPESYEEALMDNHKE